MIASPATTAGATTVGQLGRSRQVRRRERTQPRPAPVAAQNAARAAGSAVVASMPRGSVQASHADRSSAQEGWARLGRRDVHQVPVSDFHRLIMPAG
ncbi:hypothetical protein ACFQZ4_17205 [Catellatospora coxensis]